MRRRGQRRRGPRCHCQRAALTSLRRGAKSPRWWSARPRPPGAGGRDRRAAIVAARVGGGRLRAVALRSRHGRRTTRLPVLKGRTRRHPRGDAQQRLDADAGVAGVGLAHQIGELGGDGAATSNVDSTSPMRMAPTWLPWIPPRRQTSARTRRGSAPWRSPQVTRKGTKPRCIGPWWPGPRSLPRKGASPRIGPPRS